MKEFAELMFMNAYNELSEVLKVGLLIINFLKLANIDISSKRSPFMKKRYGLYIKYTEGYVWVCAAAAAPMMLKAHY
jgi:hypothetical protein